MLLSPFLIGLKGVSRNKFLSGKSTIIDTIPGGHLDFIGIILMDMHIQSAGKLFKLDQEFFSGHCHHLLQGLQSFPKGYQQRRQVFQIQRQQEIHIPVRLQ